MRASQKSNRTRGRGSRKSNGSNINRVYESSGPEGKVRGTPQQIIEKYLSLARDAQTSGNRVVAENFLQHAEHYQRILVEAMDARQERREAQQPDADQPDDSETETDGHDAAAAAGFRPREQSAQRSAGNARASEVSGLTTIDSGGSDDSNLLVDAEELSASQPRRRPRRRDSEQTDASAPTEAESQPE